MNKLGEKYKKDQLKFIKDNKLSQDSEVTVYRKIKCFTKGWNNSWSDGMNRSVGRVLRVESSYADVRGIPLSDGFSYPYQALMQNNTEELYEIY